MVRTHGGRELTISPKLATVTVLILLWSGLPVLPDAQLSAASPPSVANQADSVAQFSPDHQEDSDEVSSSPDARFDAQSDSERTVSDLSPIRDPAPEPIVQQTPSTSSKSTSTSTTSSSSTSTSSSTTSSTSSTTSSTLPNPQAPGYPEGLQITVPRHNSLRLQWDSLPDNGSELVRTESRWCCDSANRWSDWSADTRNLDDRQARITGLPVNTALLIELVGVNDFGAGPPARIWGFTTTRNNQIQSAPSALQTRHSCFLLSGSAWCWGNNQFGQLGDLSLTERRTPVLVRSHTTAALSGGTDIDVGFDHSCAIFSGQVYCWGANFWGQLGQPGRNNGGQNASSPTPQLVALPAEAVQVTSGASFSCARLTDQSVHCWGDHRAGGGTAIGRTSPQLYPPNQIDFGLTSSTDIVDLDAGDYHACAVFSDSAVRCWGENTHGQLGDGTNISNATPQAVISTSFGSETITEVAAGSGHTCVRSDAGNLFCWGDNRFGQLATTPTPSNTNTPQTVSGLGATSSLPVASIGAGERHQCAVVTGGSLYCWGSDENGQLANPNTSGQSHSPLLVGGITDVQTVRGGAFHTCAQLSTGAVHCWGANQNGQVGTTSSNLTISQPTTIPNISGATAVVAGHRHTCALVAEGEVRCWGDGSSRRLGRESVYPQAIPQPLQTLNTDGTVTSTALTGITDLSLAANGQHTCGYKANHEVWCWGSNLDNALGYETTPGVAGPDQVAVQVERLADLNLAVSGIASGGHHSCIIGTNQTVSCWGQNNLNQVTSDRSTQIVYTPTPITGVRGATQIEAGTEFTCAIGKASTDPTPNPDPSGHVYCWGTNQDQQSSPASTAQLQFPPATINDSNDNPISTATDLGVGDRHACAVLADKTVRCWGNNQDGQLGDGSMVFSSSTALTVVTGSERTALTNVEEVVAGETHTCARITAGTVHCWGNNGWGQLGADRATQNSVFPIQVPNLSEVTALSAGAHHTCALLTGGSISCWGLNIWYQSGPTTNQTTPTTALDTETDSTPYFLFHPRERLVVTVETDMELSIWLPRAIGGDGELSYRADNLPTDLSLSKNHLSGTVTSLSGIEEIFFLLASDSDDTLTDIGRFPFYLVEKESPLTFVISQDEAIVSTGECPPVSFPNLILRQDCEYQIGLPAAEGGTSPYREILTSAGLPGGMRLTPSIVQDGLHTIIFGSPTTPQTSQDFRWCLEDNHPVAPKQVCWEFTITVEADNRPHFSTESALFLVIWDVGESNVLELPVVQGGDGEINYRLYEAFQNPLPTWMTYDQANRSISATPDRSYLDTQFVWEATDEDGDMVSLLFTLRVSEPEIEIPAPPPPQGLRTEQINNTINLTWEFPYHYPHLSGYEFRYRLADQPTAWQGGDPVTGWQPMVNSSPETISHSIDLGPPATLDTTHQGPWVVELRVLAGSLQGPGTASTTSRFSLFPSRPLPPRIEDATDQSLWVVATAPQQAGVRSDGVSRLPTTTLEIRWKPNTPTGEYADASTLSSQFLEEWAEGTRFGFSLGPNGRAATSGLIPDTEYVVSFRAANKHGFGEWSPDSEPFSTRPSLTSADLAVPAPDLTMHAHQSVDVDLVWGEPNGSGITGWQYRIWPDVDLYTANPLPGWEEWAPIVGSDAATRETTITLTGRGLFFVQVRPQASNTPGNEPQGGGRGEIYLPRIPPAAPVGLYAAHNGSEFELEWFDIDDGGTSLSDIRGRQRVAPGQPLSNFMDFGVVDSIPIQTNPHSSAHTVFLWAHNHAGRGPTTEYSFRPHSLEAPHPTGVAGHSCVVTSAQTVSCWGANSFGQLGDGTTNSIFTPVTVIGSSGVSQVDTGHQHSCAATSAGAVQCWGGGSYGQLGNGLRSSSLTTVSVDLPVGTSISQVGAGAAHSCGLDQDGQVWCWGSNSHGQVGAQLEGVELTQIGSGGVTAADYSLGKVYPQPQLVLGLPVITKLAVGDWHTCALAQDGGVWCWGSNQFRQLGRGVGPNRSYPLKAWGVDTEEALSNVIDLDAGGSHNCVVGSSAFGQQEHSNLLCWGRYQDGQLGRLVNAINIICAFNALAHHCRHRLVVGGMIADATRVWTGTSHSCALRTNGELWCWGDNSSGQLGRPDTSSSYDHESPGRVTQPGNAGTITELKLGSTHSCALFDDGSTNCWGEFPQPNPISAPVNLSQEHDLLTWDRAPLGAEISGYQYRLSAADQPLTPEASWSDVPASTADTSQIRLFDLVGDQLSGQIELRAVGRTLTAPQPGSVAVSRYRLVDPTPTPVTKLNTWVADTGLQLAWAVPTLTQPEEVQNTHFEIEFRLPPQLNMSGPPTSSVTVPTEDLETVLWGSDMDIFARLWLNTPTPILTAQTQYALRIRARTGRGTTSSPYRYGPWTPPTSIQTLAEFDTKTVSGITQPQVVLTWTPPSSNPPVDSYRYRISNLTQLEQNGDWHELPASTTNSTTLSLPDLDRYLIEVQARAGTQVVEQWATQVAGISLVPAPPTNLSVEAVLVGNTWHFHAGWDQIETNGAPVERWAYRYRPLWTETWSDWTSMSAETPRTVPAAATNSVQLLLPDDLRFSEDLSWYEFELRGFNRQGWGGTSRAIVATARPGSAVSTKGKHSCLLISGSVWCWGDNDAGQLGDGTLTNQRAPVRVVKPSGEPLADVQWLSVGNRHNCAIAQLTAYCWGAGESGQLSRTRISSNAAIPVKGFRFWRVEVGDFHTCALTPGRQVYCWGGEFRDGGMLIGRIKRNEADRNLGSNTPHQVPNSADAIDLTVGATHSCLLTSAFQAKCWGYGDAGQLGRGTTDSSHNPQPIGIGGEVAEIGAGRHHTCARSGSGSIYCWGTSYWGALGNDHNDPPTQLRPHQILGITGATQLVVGPNHNCVTTSTGTVQCWGANSYNQLGQTQISRSEPQPVTLGEVNNPTAVMLGFYHTCIRSQTGLVSCWGSDAHGQLGREPVSNFHHTPTPIPETVGMDVVSGGKNYACAHPNGGKVRCWGEFRYKSLGTNFDDLSSGVAQPTSFSGFRQTERVSMDRSSELALSLSGHFGCTLLTQTQDDILLCWGNNRSGQLRVINQPVGYVPSDSYLYFPMGWDQIATGVATGSDHTCFLNEEGEVFCWGSNGFGQLDRPTETQDRSDEKIHGVRGATHIDAGDHHTCAIARQLLGSAQPPDPDPVGYVLCWGASDKGQSGSSSNPASVTQVQSITTATDLAVGVDHSCALVADGTVWCWGDNSYGQLGTGATTSPSSTPTQVPVNILSGVTQISAGAYHTCALRSNNTVWCWGRNQFGQLGQPPSEPLSSPSQIGSFTATRIGMGNDFSCAIVPIPVPDPSNGGNASTTTQVYCWGNNSWGQSGPSAAVIAVSEPVTTATPPSLVRFGATLNEETIELSPVVPNYHWLPTARGGEGAVTYLLTPNTLPAGMVQEDNLLTGIPTAATLDETVYTWSATDTEPGSNNGPTHLFTFRMGSDSRPQFSSNHDLAVTLKEGNIARFRFPTVETGGDGLVSYSASPTTPPPGMSWGRRHSGDWFGNSVLEGVPTQPGTYTYVWTATDSDVTNPDSDHLTFTITVEEDLNPSFATVVADQEWFYSAAINTFTVVLPDATGGDGVLSYSFHPNPLPHWLTWDPTNNTLTGNPDQSAVGSNRIVLVATDQDGDYATLAFTISVVADTAPTFGTDADSFSSPQWYVGQQVNLTLPAATGGNGPLRYRLSPALPVGLNFDPISHTITGMPTVRNYGPHQFQLAVTDSDPPPNAPERAVWNWSATMPNRAPTPVGTLGTSVLSNQTETIEVPLFGLFAEPDNEVLRYSVSGFDSTIISVVVATTSQGRLPTGITANTPAALPYRSLFVTGEINNSPSPQQTPVTITAIDPEGSSATLELAVQVRNGIPRWSGPPRSDVELARSETVRFFFEFDDPEDSPLTISADADPPGVVTVATSPALDPSSQLSYFLITALRRGSTTVTITANDTIRGHRVSSPDFGITVANSPPSFATTTERIALSAGTIEWIDLSQAFTDADDDPLTYTVLASTATTTMVDSAICLNRGDTDCAGNGHWLRLTPTAKGTQTIVVVASDNFGGRAEGSFTVNVNNHPPEATAIAPTIPDLTVGETITIAGVSTYFTDPDPNDTLTVTEVSAVNLGASSGENEWIEVSYQASTDSLTITPRSKGDAQIRVTVSDETDTFTTTWEISVINRAPVQIAGTSLTPVDNLVVGGSILVRLDNVVSDPDGDELSFSLVGTNSFVGVTSSNNQGMVLGGVTATPPGAPTTITIRAADDEGLGVEVDLMVTVTATSLSDGSAPLPTTLTLQVDANQTYDLSTSFVTTSVNTILEYSVSVLGGASGLTSTVTGTQLLLTAVAKGEYQVQVDVNDPEVSGPGGATRRILLVTVPNQPPTVVGSIPDQEVEIGRRVWLDLSAFFTDEDQDQLSFRVAEPMGGELSGVICVRQDPNDCDGEGSWLLLNASRKGSYQLSVTADDGEDAVTALIDVTVPNRAPRLLQMISVQQVNVQQTLHLDLSTHFSDADLDSLTYTVSKSQTDQVSTSICTSSMADATCAGAGSWLRMVAHQQGRHSVTVTADDGQDTVSAELMVVVPNRDPILSTPIDRIILDWDRPHWIDLDQHFTDPDTDTLSYRFDLTASALEVEAELCTDQTATDCSGGAWLRLTPSQKGSVTIRLTISDGFIPPAGSPPNASDDDGEITVQINVTTPNRGPVLTSSAPPPPATVFVGAAHPLFINLSDFYSDPDGDDLTYTARSNSVYQVTSQDRGLSIAGIRANAAPLPLIYTVSDGEDQITGQLMVTVTDPPPVSSTPTTEPSPSSPPSTSNPSPTSPPATQPHATQLPDNQPVNPNPSIPTGVTANPNPPNLGGSQPINFAGTPSVTTSTTVAEPPTAISFADTSDNTHQTNITQLAQLGITRGCNPPENTNFCPQRPVSRAEMATFLVRALDLSPSGQDLFADDDGNTHEMNINSLASAGITRGCNPPTNDRFCPLQPVTRAQMATFLARALDLDDGSTSFADTSETVHTNDINRIASVGITLGCNPPQNTEFCPQRPVSRAEMATFLIRALRTLPTG